MERSQQLRISLGVRQDLLGEASVEEREVRSNPRLELGEAACQPCRRTP
jgi:hypothetical protein